METADTTHTNDILQLKTKTYYLTGNEFAEITYLRGCSFDIYNNSDFRLFNVNSTANTVSIFCPFQVLFSDIVYCNITPLEFIVESIPFMLRYNNLQYCKIDSDGILFENAGGIIIKMDTIISGSLFQSGICLLAQNTTGVYTSGMSIKNLSDDTIIQQYKVNKTNDYNDATISVDRSESINFPNYIARENDGVLTIQAETIILDARTIILGLDSRTQVNIAGSDFTEYFAQYVRRRT